jgi:hypothetical protein
MALWGGTVSKAVFNLPKKVGKDIFLRYWNMSHPEATNFMQARCP